MFGQPGADNALETVYNNFSAATQALATSPDSAAARYGVLTAGQTLAQHLNGMTADIQGLRSDAEAGLGDAVQQANDAMRQIASINIQLGQSNVEDATTAVLRDTRDAAIDKLIAENPKSLQDYKAGKQAALGSLMGMVMKSAKGLNPKMVQEALRKRLGS